MGFQGSKFQQVVFILAALLFGLGLALRLVQYAQAVPGSPAAADGWAQLTSPTAPGGSVLDLAVAENTPETIYALLQGSPAARLYYSQDAALSWTQHYTFNQQVDNIALDPADPDSVYAGGEAGLFHSTESGLSWTQIYTLGQVVEVVSATLIYAGGQIASSPECWYGEVLMATSTDGGTSWASSSLGCTGELAALAVNPQNPQIAFAASVLDGKVDEIWRSGDGGQSWQSVLSYPWLTWGPYSLVIDPQAPQHIYVTDGYGLNYSLDDGQTWNDSDALPQNAYKLAFGNNSLYAVPYWGSQGIYVYRSNDGGFTWWQTLQKLPQGAWALQAAPDGTLYAGLWAYGVWRSLNSGASWQEADSGIRSPVFVQAIAADPGQPGRLYAGSDYPRPGLFQSQNGGLNWSQVITDIAFMAVAVYPHSPNIVYAGGMQGLFEITDSEHWEQIWYDGDVYDIAFSSHTHPWILFGGEGPLDFQGFVAHYDPDTPPGVWGWHRTTLPNTWRINAVAASSYDPYTFYAAGITNLKSACIWRSQDGGQNWQEVFSSEYLYAFSDLLADSFHAGWIYAAGTNGIYISQDNGNTWTPFNSNLPADIYEIAQDEMGNVYAAGFYGLYYLPAGQSTWQPFGLPQNLLSLVARPGVAPALFAGGGASVWRYDLPFVTRIWLPVIRQ